MIKQDLKADKVEFKLGPMEIEMDHRFVTVKWKGEPIKSIEIERLQKSSETGVFLKIGNKYYTLHLSANDTLTIGVSFDKKLCALINVAENSTKVYPPFNLPDFKSAELYVNMDGILIPYRR